MGFKISDQIIKILKNDHTRFSVITSVLTSLLLFFYIFSISSFFHVGVFPFENRITSFVLFESYVISENIDHIILIGIFFLWLLFSVKKKVKYAVSIVIPLVVLISLASNTTSIISFIALSSLPLVFALLIYHKYTREKFLVEYPHLTLTYLAILGIILGVMSSISILLSFFSFTVNPFIQYNHLYAIFLILSSFSSILILLLLAGFPTKLISNYLTSILKTRKFDVITKKKLSIKTNTVSLLLIISISVFIAILPHLEEVNIANQQISVDTSFYVKWLTELQNSQNVSEVFQQAFVIQNAGDRPITLLSIFLISEITDVELFDIIEFLPLILGPMLVLAIFFLTREITSNDTTSLLASFITTISFQTTIGIYAGFFANWLALVIGFFSFVFIFRYLKNSNLKYLITFVILMIVLVFTHANTWTVLSVVMIIFLLVTLKLNREQRKSVLLLLLIISFTIVIDVSRASITDSISGIQRDIGIAEELTGLDQYTSRWKNLRLTESLLFGGQFSNFIIFGLGLFWLIKSDLRHNSTIFLLIFLSIGLIPLIFGEWLVQSRILYNIPFQIPAAIAMTYVTKKKNGILIVGCLCMWLLIIAIRDVLNFPLVLPTG